MRRILGSLVMGIGLAAATAPALRAETLADALAFGYEHSGLLEQNRALLRAADEDVAQALSALRPVLNWSADARATRGPDPAGGTATDTAASASLTASLLLYDGGASRYAIDAQKALVLATRESLRGIEQQVLQRIVEAYLEIQRAIAFVDLRQNNLRLITQELRAARDRFEVGEVTRTDVSLAEARLAAARSQLAADEGALTQARAEFRAAVGRAPGNLSPAPDARIPSSLAEAQNIARRTHPALREAQQRVTVAELNIARAEAATRPEMTLSGGITVNDDFDDNERIGIDVGAPIYAGGRIASQVRQAQARRDAARGDLLNTARTIERNVANAYSFLAVARAGIEASGREVTAAQLAFDGLREEAALGARTTLDVLDAEQDLLDARTNLVSAQIDETLATYSVLAATGQLTAQQLGLAVQVYDPAAYYNLVRNAPAAKSEQGRALDRVLEAIGR
ncbi:TolC family outer membrane protein [Limimaricola pyoseonensis]|uniref:Outer membrane protein n=1 Tax=Limimaricola pyoseonensis TaxID=521013 RepID=A0A1G7DGW3_9RHOB|nr:TolC family outer membrane protein [Limimaricola pyoseonensis]SDE50296.1 outer membrane protein [Limimaricola pyoseonensis]